MGRSVSVPSDAVATVYLACEIEDEWDWTDFIDDLQDTLIERFPSFDPCDRWVGREEKAVLENHHGKVVVAEYCGLVSVSLVPEEYSSGYSDDAQRGNLAEAWCNKVAGTFTTYLHDRYQHSSLQKLGTMSDGCGVYKRICGPELQVSEESV